LGFIVQSLLSNVVFFPENNLFLSLEPDN
jgi:hypothetical protein